ncbi:EamA family transporter RarD [Flexibacterium corallicola]|uniref:EamA family transporter RarD n=1 Tax=Flexibacterium corallicola TaxID=3037259 RepID=UPI00286F2CE5|nr:EamA family transporter RarD [Pseudovibrio sp. M1P-2-3]
MATFDQSAENAISDADYKMGLLSAATAYFIWGIAPLYFKLTASSPALVVVCYRVLTSVVAVGILLGFRQQLYSLLHIFKNKALLWRIALASFVLTSNWLVFIWSIEVGRVLDASFGYFINPLVSVALGVVVLSERLSRGQMIAVALSVIGITYQIVAMGTLPLVSLFLAFTFATYALIRKKTEVAAIPGQLAEVICMSPLALIGLFYLGGQGTSVAPLAEVSLFLALLGTGVVTAAPLILFTFGARRIPMIYVGFLQYIAPSLQFILAYWIFGEALSTDRLISFIIIWVSLGVFTLDGFAKTKSAQ